MCQNSVAYDTTLNPTGIDPISRITDGTVIPSGASMGNFTFSGGDNDIMGSVNETYLAWTSGQVYVQHMKVGSDGSYQVVNTGNPGIHVAGPFGFSKVTDTRFYYLVSETQLWKGDITSDSAFTATELYDVSGNGGFTQCPGVNWGTFGTPNSASIMGISQNDQRFAWAVGTGGQGSAVWAFVWDQTLGCASVNFKTGNYWNFTTSGSSSTPPNGTLSTTGDSCWGFDDASVHGIHDMQMSGYGTHIEITIQSAGQGTYPTQGICAPPNPGNTIVNQSITYNIGTATTEWMYGAVSVGVGGPNFGSHSSVGVTNIAAPFNNGPTNNEGPNIRPVGNVASFSGFAASASPPTNVILSEDEHCSWPHPLNDDSYPWICASDLVTSVNGGSLAPNYMHNVIYAWFPSAILPLGLAPRLFSHTFSCGDTATTTCASGVGDNNFGSQQSIGYVTAKGNYFCWASTHLQSLGLDNSSHPRADGFCVKLQ
jgi:hypothetical protein